MDNQYQPLLTDAFLRSHFGQEAEAFRGSAQEAALIDRLRAWASRGRQTETQAEAGFLKTFFFELWDFWPDGTTGPAPGYTAFPRHPVPGAGAGGAGGFADLALGWFDHPPVPPTPQVVCEFKDIRSDLDAPQRRKGSTRSPVKQCADYMRGLELPLFQSAPIQPRLGIVTDMNEFRLYWRDTMPAQSLRFAIARRPGWQGPTLLDDSPEGSVQRFLFARLLHRDMLLSRTGEPPFIALLRAQLVREKELERAFYAEYRAYREALIEALLTANPAWPHTPGRMVRVAQKLLDRLIFVLFCEDMGQQIAYPPQVLRDRLLTLARDPHLSPIGDDAWDILRRLFRSMDQGGSFGGHALHRFNGGLFHPDPELDGLDVPNHVFFSALQAGGEAALRAPCPNLLYFAANYNFGTVPGGRAITLYTLGRIFEQSITELEALEAARDGRPSLTVVTKRKRDGVYYTPEWVVALVVEETVGPRLAALRAAAGWDEDAAFTEAEIARQGAPVRRQVEAIGRYQVALRGLTVLDPACGSGAFLIHALDYLLREARRVEAERQRLSGGQAFLFDDDAATKDILSRNIFGVDINPASVELARLALWLHTARAGSALSDLDATIRDGNSLVGPDIANVNPDYALLPDTGKERINPFDWAAAFPQVMARGGFDCVVGNPPYVKLQNYKRVLPEVAEYLARATAPGLGTSGPRYRSAQTGNTDLFLPFIEKGLALLAPEGRMGVIAPSLWLLNEYGEGLRRLVHAGRHLDRWVDFGAFQVFEEAITYTALQFFTAAPNDHVRFVDASSGTVVADWTDPRRAVPYAALPGAGPWTLLPEAERNFMAALQGRCDRLDAVSAITVGLQTSADNIYHLRRLAPGRYETAAGTAVALEDALLLPLVSGKDVSRWATPAPRWHILFPYAADARGEMRLIPLARMEAEFPLALAYLRGHEAALRARDNGRNDDDAKWWGYIYPKNLDKQDKPKLLVPRLLLRLGCAVDPHGTFALDNVDVGGVLPADPADLWFLAAVLNGRLANWAWRLTSKPFQNDYRSANKQFIAPLPIPRADAATRAALGRRARIARALHARRARALALLDRRLSVCAVVTEKEEWLLPGRGVQPLADLRRAAPAAAPARERTAWAKARQAAQVAQAMTEAAVLLTPGAALAVAWEGGELRLSADGMPVFDRIFLPPADGPFIALQWRLALRGRAFMGEGGAKALAAALRAIRRTANPELARQAIAAGDRVLAYDAAIARNDAATEDALDRAYGLTLAEMAVLDSGRG